MGNITVFTIIIITIEETVFISIFVVRDKVREILEVEWVETPIGSSIVPGRIDVAEGSRGSLGHGIEVEGSLYDLDRNKHEIERLVIRSNLI